MRASSVVAAAVAFAAACSRPSPRPLDPGGAHRVVSLAPSTTEALFAIGAGDRTVARSRYCDFPPEARALPTVGDVQPDLEGVLGLRPDLVVGLGGLTSDHLTGDLRARGIQTWFPISSSLESIDDLLIGLGERTGHAEDARRVVAALDTREHEIERSVAAEPKPRVILMVSVTPLIAAGPKSFADELIAAAGAENVIAEGSPWPTIGFERLLDLDPDVVLDAVEVDAERATLISPDAPGWGGLRAVREGHVVRVLDERVLRAGPRIAEGLAILAQALHPRAHIH
jgi:iron complex transport system substrate-binding protein